MLPAVFFAGIWQTYNVYNPPPGWEILPNFEEDYPNGMGYGGVASIAFRNSNELYAANLIYVNSKNYYSTKVFKYDYNANPAIWTQLGALPFANQMDVKINKIVFYPNDPDRVFLCTSAGLVESADAGATWFNSPSGNPVSGNIFNIVFIEKSTPGDYFWYISGSDTPGNDYQGHAMLMESDNGAAFADVTAFSGNFSNIHSYAGLCLGDQTATNGDRDILIYTAIDQGSDWASNNRNVHKATKNIINTTNPIVVNFIKATGQEYHNVPSRMIIGYDATNNRVIVGGVKIKAINLNLTNFPYTSIGSPPHDDFHAIYINTSVSPNDIFIGCDGGFYTLTFGTTSYSASRLNFGLNIALINGFSGATERNEYVYGYQDHIYADYYDESSKNVIATKLSHENDGGLIDKFNDNQIIITDYSSYGYTYCPSSGGYSNMPGSQCIGMYYPHQNPNYYFQPGNAIPSIYLSQGFGRHPFFQQPFREGRIFTTSSGGSIFQFDPVSLRFVWKVRLQETTQQFTCNPDLKSTASPGCSSVFNSPFLELHTLGWQGQPSAMSFSQLDKNVMYVTTANNPDQCCFTASQVVRFIGNDLDDLWLDYNEIVDNNNNPQWQLITPDWLSAPFNIPANDYELIYRIIFSGVETSNWNKDVIYVSCNYEMSPPLPFKVIKFDGATHTWSDYSDSLPANAYVTSMVMDHASNDGLYISTEMGVYYREEGMSSWVYYNLGELGPDNKMPALSSRQMEINYRENTIRAGTYGRGIWKSGLVCPSNVSLTITDNPVSGYKEADDIETNGTVITASTGVTVFRATNSITLEPGFMADASPSTNFFFAYIHGCQANSSTSSYNYFRTNFDISQSNFENFQKPQSEKLSISPNPSASGIFNISFKNLPADGELSVFNIMGLEVKRIHSISDLNLSVSLEGQAKGIYLFKYKDNASGYQTKKVVYH